MSIYIYRGYTIMKNNVENNGMKWTTLELEDMYSKTIDEMKNALDERIGGYATAKIPKRRLKND